MSLTLFTPAVTDTAYTTGTKTTKFEVIKGFLIQYADSLFPVATDELIPGSDGFFKFDHLTLNKYVKVNPTYLISIEPTTFVYIENVVNDESLEKVLFYANFKYDEVVHEKELPIIRHEEDEEELDLYILYSSLQNLY